MTKGDREGRVGDMILPLHPPQTLRCFLSPILPLPNFPGKQQPNSDNMLYPGTKPQEHPFLFQDGLARSRSDDRHFSSWEAMNRASRARKTAQNYANQIGDQDDHSSGFCSPPLWKTSPSSSPPHERSHYRSLSPASKAQVIARGQRELMDMVKNMPESCYELSLRDLVEQPAMLDQTKQTEQDLQRDYQKKRRNVNNNSKKQGQGLRRSGTMENHNGGFLLKMVFPVSFWSKKKKGTKKNESLASNSSAKVSPKPPLVSGEGPRGVDKEWWKKGFSATSGDNSETDQSSSLNSGSMKSSISSSRSSSRSSTRQGSGGCWWFMGKRKSKNAE